MTDFSNRYSTVSDVSLDEKRATIILEEIQHCRRQISTRLAEAEEKTVPEVLFAGNKINEIVETAKSSIQHTSSSMESSLKIMLDTMNDYTVMTDNQLETQTSNIEEAIRMTKNIVNVGHSIKSLAASARMLTISSKIVASTFGSYGSIVGILSNEMKELSNKIAAHNAVISDLTTKLLGTLPLIVSSAQEIRQESHNVVDRLNQMEQDSMATFEKSQKANNDTINSIIGKAYEALSHLQFHDPHIQKIKGIDTILYQLLQRLSDELNKSLELEPPLLGTHHLK